MSSVGINFGSATSGAGFDVASTVTSILAVASAIETPWKTQLTSLNAQDTALSTVGSDLSTLATAVNSLTQADGVLAQKQGSSSDTSVLALSAASSSAVAGSHTVTVKTLAQTSSEYSDPVANATDTLTGSLSIQIGSGHGQTITLNAPGETLSALAGAINQGSYGVNAGVVSDGSGARLSLVSQTSGAAGQITLTPALTDSTTSAAVNFATGQSGLDATLNVDGLDTSSSSNTVTGIIPGVTFQLLAASPNTQVQVQIENNNGAVETAVQSLVTGYNAVISALKTQEGKDSTGAAEPLYGSPTLALIQNQLSASLLSGSPSGAVSNIGQLGLSLEQDGTLQFNSDTLDATLNSNYSDVQGYLQNAGSFGQGMSSTLNSLGTNSPTGALTLALTQNSTVETGLNGNISAEDARIADEKLTLTDELNTANQILQAIPSQLNEVDEIYSATTGYNQTKS